MTVAVIVGPPEHGVVRLAEQLAAADPAVVAVRAPSVAQLPAVEAGHVHFTDGLFGAHCDRAADAFVSLATAGRLSVTLHDVPQFEAGSSSRSARYRRRAAAYRRVVEAVDGRAVVSSAAEAAEVFGFSGLAPAVIALPIDATAPSAARVSTDDAVGVVGFVYPGKGHAQALAGLATLPARAGLLVLGRAADGHDDLVVELRAAAARLGRSMTVTGYLGDVELTARMRGVRVPLAAHESISASGSIGSWLGAGRRPLVSDGPWTRELEQRLPGCVHRFAPGELPAALESAWHDPRSTWLAPGFVVGPSTVEAAAQYRTVLAGFGGLVSGR